MLEQFIREVDAGLSAVQKHLPSKYFYDARGDALFSKIMAMPEYYLTRAELEIFTEQAEAIITALDFHAGDYFDLIELGAGDGLKTKKLLQVLMHHQYQFDFIPIDISANVLDILAQSVMTDLPEVVVKPRQGDYMAILASLKNDHHPKAVLFLGSNMGNMSDTQASKFLQELGENLNPGDSVLLGVDLIKSADIVLPAYNDAQHITRDFNLNLLRRINRELEGDFDLAGFAHAPEYTEEEGIARSFLVSQHAQTVTIGKIGKQYHFSKGERIFTEVSRKYSREILEEILAPTDLRIVAEFNDSQHYFADFVLRREMRD
jgi:L-histidine Nalpha-methyltransferase